MPQFLQPDPVILGFIAFKQTLYLPILLLLALVRTAVARSTARWLGLLALVLAAAGIAVQVVPAMLNLYDSPLVAIVDQWRKAQGGMTSLLTASAPLLLSAFAPGRRWWGIDLLHVLLLVALGGLWAYSVWM